MAEILALGELLMDCIVENDRVIQANPGGAPCNYLAAASKYGVPCAYIGKVGLDEYGLELRRTLENCGIDCGGMVMDPSCETTKAFVKLDPDGDRSFSFSRDADMKLNVTDVDRTLVDACRIFHFSGSLSLTDDPCRTTLHETAEYAGELGRLISYDPNFRELAWNGDMENARRELRWGCKIAHIIKISADEAEFIGVTVEELLRNAFLVMVTKDAGGASLYSRSAWADIECPKVNVVDTTGAGDIFNGAAASRLLRILDEGRKKGVSDKKVMETLNKDQLTQIGRFAVTAASLSTSRYGAIPSIPDISEI